MASATNLLYPLNEDILKKSLVELPPSTRRTIETSYSCLLSRKFTSEEFLQLIFSVSSQSPLLSSVFRDRALAAPSSKRKSYESYGHIGSCYAARTTPAAKRAKGGKTPSQTPFMVCHSQQAITFQRMKEAAYQPFDMSNTLVAGRKLEAIRRRFDPYRGSEPQRRRMYLQEIFSKFVQALPSKSRASFLLLLRQYNASSIPPEDFVLGVQQLVDQHSICIPLKYKPEYLIRSSPPPVNRACSQGSMRGSAQQEEAAKKQSKAFRARRPQQPLSRTILPAVAEDQLKSAHAPSASSSSSSSSSSSGLSKFLTDKVASSCSSVVIRVLYNSSAQSQQDKFACSKKAIFAFRRDAEGSREILIFGLFSHEYDDLCPRDVSRRTYIDCVDSIPLLENETIEERQSVLSAILYGYIEYLSKRGFRQLLLRVPPPEESSHIFNPRTPSIRTEATIRMSCWYKRLLEGAKSHRLLHNYSYSSHVFSLKNFPIHVLPAEVAHIECQHPTSMQDQPAHPRFFAADLFSAGNFAGDVDPLLYNQVFSDRKSFTSFCDQQNLSFTTTALAQSSTEFLMSSLQAFKGMGEIQSSVSVLRPPPLEAPTVVKEEATDRPRMDLPQVYVGEALFMPRERTGEERKEEEEESMRYCAASMSLFQDHGTFLEDEEGDLFADSFFLKF